MGPKQANQRQWDLAGLPLKRLGLIGFELGLFWVKLGLNWLYWV